MSNPTTTVQKLWNYISIAISTLLSYDNYAKLLTFLQSFKMFNDSESVVSANLHNPARLQQAVFRKGFKEEL